MSKRLVAILASVVISLGAIGGGAKWLGDTAYEDGIKMGIGAVIQQCAEHDSTFYDGNTGNVMTCQGGHITQGQKTPGNPVPEASSPMPSAGEPKKERDFIGDPIPEQNI